MNTWKAIISGLSQIMTFAPVQQGFLDFISIIETSGPKSRYVVGLKYLTIGAVTLICKSG